MGKVLLLAPNDGEIGSDQTRFRFPSRETDKTVAGGSAGIDPPQDDAMSLLCAEAAEQLQCVPDCQAATRVLEISTLLSTRRLNHV